MGDKRRRNLIANQLHALVPFGEASRISPMKILNEEKIVLCV